MCLCVTYMYHQQIRKFSTLQTLTYDQLRQNIVKFNDLGKVFVSGHLNGRTSADTDYFIFDKYLDRNSLLGNAFDIPTRVNKDSILDYNGRHN